MSGLNDGDYLEPEVNTSKDVRHKAKCKSRAIKSGKRKSSRVSAPRIRELEEVYKPTIFEKTDSEVAMIKNALARNFVFRNVMKRKSDNVQDQLIRAFEPVDEYKKGDIIIQQFDTGDYFYILARGSVTYEDKGKQVGGANKVGTSFGELALLYQSPRAATVKADSDDVRLFRLDQISFRYILQSRSKFKALGMQAVTKIKATNRLLSFVGKTALLSNLDDSDDEDDGGKENAKTIETPTVVGKISEQVVEAMEAAAEAAESDDGEFEEFIGELSKRRNTIRSSMQSRRLSVDTFKRNSILGSGQYGQVWLVNPKIEDIDKEQFALKIQKKEDMEREKSFAYSVEEALRRECKVLSGLCHPMIVDLVHSFEDEENFYMVLGVIKGLELWDCIHRQIDGEWVSGFPEEDAKFYALMIADTLDYIHTRQICHRDIKPENVMVGQNGYPILIDFGFGKILPDNITFTLCGTPKYTAPEIIGNEGHGCAVDLWSLGVVIYEMLSGENPFWYDDISDLQLLSDICNAEPFPIQDEVQVSEEALDLIAKLLQKDPNKRLAGHFVASHPCFDGMDLNKARRMLLPAPWTPDL